MFGTGISLLTDYVVLKYLSWLTVLYWTIPPDWMYSATKYPYWLNYFILECLFWLQFFYPGISTDRPCCTETSLLTACVVELSLLTDRIVLTHPYWPTVLYWNISTDWIFCRYIFPKTSCRAACATQKTSRPRLPRYVSTWGISLLTECFVLTYPYWPVFRTAVIPTAWILCTEILLLTCISSWNTTYLCTEIPLQRYFSTNSSAGICFSTKYSAEIYFSTK